MAHVLPIQFKWFLILMVITVFYESDVTNSQKNVTCIYPTFNNSIRNCSKYNNTKRYDGKVCGNDGITYPNKRYLWCLNEVNNDDVAIAHPGLCLHGEERCQRNYVYSPVCAFDGKIWSNIESLRCYNIIHNISIETNLKGNCKNNSNNNDDDDANNGCICSNYELSRKRLNPACASDGFTYKNIDEIICSRRKNPNLRIRHDGSCTVDDVLEIFKTKENICDISESRTEPNPVYGSDGKKYANPFIFLCKKLTKDPELQAVFEGESSLFTYQACLRACGNDSYCRRTGENKRGIENTNNSQVCGYDGITYETYDHLICKTHRDRHLHFKHHGQCRGPNDNPCGSVHYYQSQFPICASNNVTYVSIEAMWCVNRQTDNDFYLLHDGPCLDSK